MTEHALERIAERAPGINPEHMLRWILERYDEDGMTHIADSVVSGKALFRFDIEGQAPIFPVMSDDGFVVTVLEIGMTFHSDKGRIFCGDRPLEPGIHFDVDAAHYHRDPSPAPSLSSTLVRLVLGKSPAHAWTASPRLNPDWEPTDSATFDFGRAAHSQILGKGGGYAVYPADILGKGGAVSTAAAKEWAAQTRAEGLTPIKEDAGKRILDMSVAAKSALREISAAGYDLPIVAERSEVVAISEIDGCMCRAMFDNAPEDPRLPLIDFKTTTDATPGGISKAVWNYGYALQAAFYLDVWKAATGEDRDFLFIFQEKEPPYGLGLAMLKSEALAEARVDVADARHIWARCVAQNNWPSYPPVITNVSEPGWKSIKREDERAWRDAAGQINQEDLRRAYLWQAPNAEEAVL